MTDTKHKLLGQFGYTVAKSALTLEERQLMKKQCTVTTTVLPAFQAFQKPKKYTLYYEDKDYLYLPRYYGLQKLGPPSFVALSSGHPMHPDVKCVFEPLAHQANGIAKLKEVLDKSKQLGDGGVYSLPCGYGKTFCATYGACYLGLSTLVVVTTENLMDQFEDAIRTFAPAARIGRIQGDKVDVKDKDFVVAMLHSLCQRNYPIQLYDQFGLTIFDECHHLGSEMFCKAMMKIRTKFTLGLSATPERADGLSPVFYKFLGPLFHSEKRSGSNRIIVKKLATYSNDDAYRVLYMGNAGTKNTGGMITALAMCDKRNELLIRSTEELLKQGYRVLLISGRKEHLRDLKKLMDARQMPTANGTVATTGLYFGYDQRLGQDMQAMRKGMTQKQFQKAFLKQSAKCDVVLGIDALAKEGLDIPDRNALVMASPPGMNVEQMVGRILRKFHAMNPVVVDVVDQTGNFPRHATERTKWYRGEEYYIQNERLELDGDEWEERLCSLLYKNDIPVGWSATHQEKAEKAKKKKAAEPSVDNCLL